MVFQPVVYKVKLRYNKRVAAFAAILFSNRKSTEKIIEKNKDEDCKDADKSCDENRTECDLFVR